MIAIRLCLALLLGFSLPLYGAMQILPGQKGQVDAKDLVKENVYRLSGDWAYFPNETLSPEDVIKDPQGVMARSHTLQPGVGFTDGAEPLMKSSLGFATYLLKIDNLPLGHWALWGLSAWTSSRVFLFDAEGKGAERPVIELGKFSIVPEENLPQVTTRELVSYEVRAKTSHYVIIQVANFHHAWGGLWSAPVLASYKTALVVYADNDRMNYLLIGISAFVSFYSLALFLRRRSDLTNLFLCLFAGERALRNYWWANYGFDWLGDLTASFELDYKLVWFFWMPSAIFMFLFYRAAFPRQMSKLFIKVFAAFAFIPYLFVLITPSIVHFSFARPYYTLLLPAVGLACIRVVYRALRAKEEGSGWLLTGVCMIVCGSLLDVAYTYNLILTTYNNITGVSIVGFLVCQAQIISQRSATAFNQAEHLSKELKTEVNRQTRDIKSILSTIKQGIFSIHSTKDPIDPQYSKHLEQIIGVSSVEDQNLQLLLLDRSDLNSDEKAQIVSCLDASLREDLLGFELNQGNLPKQLNYKEASGTVKILEVDWAPMLDADQTIEKILVNLRDVTEIRLLQTKATQQEEDLKILIELINIPEDRFHRFITKALDYLIQNRQLLSASSSPKPEILKQLFMNMHTIKGTARTYLLRAIANASHEAENRYSMIQQGKSEWEEQSLLQDLDRVEHLIEHYRSVGKDKLGWQLSERLIKLPAKTLENVMQNLNQIAEEYLNPKQKSQINAARSMLVHYGFVRLQDVIDEACRGLDSIARDLEKPNPRIEVEAPIIVMKDEGVNTLHGILIHMLRNSLDHGIEVTEIREKKGKKPVGTIFISCQTSLDWLTLSVYDDGKGLDLEAIKQRAMASNLMEANRSYSPQEIAEKIFESGLSTKDGISEISGRGVGLSAVLKYVRGVGGNVRLLLAGADNPKAVKFHFEIDLPSRFWFPIEPGNEFDERRERAAG